MRLSKLLCGLNVRGEAKRRLAENTLGRDKLRAITRYAAKEEYFQEQSDKIRAATAAD
jgi:hypothetical protein